MTTHQPHQPAHQPLQPAQSPRILFGAAYYDEYMPYDRLAEDVRMLKAAHMNTVRIAESTWATMEPQPGVFDFTHIDRVLDAMGEAGIGMIVGTPTYAVPSWLTQSHPDVLATTPGGKRKPGPRQNMNQFSATYRFYAERAIRALSAHVAAHPAVIGWQVDNETTHFDVVDADVQRMFVRHLRERFHDDLDAMNRAFGLNYWSNRINAWEDVPDVTATINASLGGEFDRFRRALVAEYIGWQATIVREYARPDQFVTQNFDLDWRGGSYGVQPRADDWLTSAHLDYAGIDIYHPSAAKLDGRQIAVGGDLARSFKGGRNWLLMETEAQGNMGWLPFPGQLRLQGFSHLANGSESVMYWHWASLHNACETYWKGVLSHDLKPNRIYREASALGAELERIGGRLAGLRKRNRVAIIASNASLSALNRFRIDSGVAWGGPNSTYNDVVRWVYDALFDLNVECDFLPGDWLDGGTLGDFSEAADGRAFGDGETGGGSGNARVQSVLKALEPYDLVIAPALYCTSQALIDGLRAYVAQGGHLLSTFKSFFSDLDATVWHDRQPHGLADVFGAGYDEFTNPDEGTRLAFAGPLDGFGGNGNDGDSDKPSDRPQALTFMELLEPNDDAVDGQAGDAATQVLARYDHPAWGDWAAITRHAFGGNGGWAERIGTMTDAPTIRAILREAVSAAGIDDWPQRLAGTLTVRRGINPTGERLAYLLNYSGSPVEFVSPVSGEDLLAESGDSDANRELVAGETVTIVPWGLRIVAER
ncbi:beta-galactosidase [Bifidobacterium vespertilionis]|uniref:beta-galactosidase n=1 Tax=Bifidobacterium vespertilionis TaxID=2562524 RepID=UPI0016867EB2|nr:alpha-amylase family protein [Bifidobacterium vespertilionis]